MKQAIIYFDENLSAGFSKPRRKKIALYFNKPRCRINCEDYLREKGAFVSTNHPSFFDVVDQIEKWSTGGINSTYDLHFDTLEDYNKWRAEAPFNDHEVHWHLLIENDDQSWDLHLETGLAFPQQLEEIYLAAKKLRK